MTPADAETLALIRDKVRELNQSYLRNAPSLDAPLHESLQSSSVHVLVPLEKLPTQIRIGAKRYTIRALYFQAYNRELIPEGYRVASVPTCPLFNCVNPHHIFIRHHKIERAPGQTPARSAKPLPSVLPPAPILPPIEAVLNINPAMAAEWSNECWFWPKKNVLNIRRRVLKNPHPPEPACGNRFCINPKHHVAPDREPAAETPPWLQPQSNSASNQTAEPVSNDLLDAVIEGLPPTPTPNDAAHLLRFVLEILPRMAPQITLQQILHQMASSSSTPLQTLASNIRQQQQFTLDHRNRFLDDDDDEPFMGDFEDESDAAF